MRSWPVAKRLEHALVQGITEFVEEDTEEGPGTGGRPGHRGHRRAPNGRDEVVGDLFGRERCSFRMVVKSARVMKRAVAWLIPFIE